MTDDQLAARDALVLAHQHLPREVARTYARRWHDLELDDLVAVAQVGLLEAASRYDPRRGTFERFAVYRIYGAIRDHLRTLDLRSRHERERGRVTGEVVARRTVPLSEIDQQTMPAADGWEQVHRAIDAAWLGRRLRARVADLPRRERTLIESHYWRGQRLQDMGPVFGVHASRISQLHARALRLLRQGLLEQGGMAA